jgi:hypothetical protein
MANEFEPYLEPPAFPRPRQKGAQHNWQCMTQMSHLGARGRTSTAPHSYSIRTRINFQLSFIFYSVI